MVHFDGDTWSELELDKEERESLYDVWGDETGHVFAVGSEAVHHFDGDTWSRTDIPGAGFDAVWGSSASDVYAVGYPTYHYDGHAWTEVEGLSGTGLDSVWGSRSDDVYALNLGSRSCTSTAYSGRRCTKSTTCITCLTSGCPRAARWCARAAFVSADRRRAAVLYYDGASWEWIETGKFGTFESVSGTGDGGAILVGEEELAIYFKGGSWRFLHPGRRTHLNEVWGSVPDNVRHRGGRRVRLPLRLGIPPGRRKCSKRAADVNSVWGFSADDVFAVGGDGSDRPF